MDFDIALTRPEFFYARYSDDILVLGADKQRLHTLANEMKVRLEELRLTLNESKTFCCSLEEGVDFLGYHLDSSGKSIPAKAEDRLYDRLETMWLTNPSLSVEEKASKALEIIGGWQQYYREEREMRSIHEFVALAYAVGGRKEMLPLLQQKRPALKNACRDITDYMCQLWKKAGSDELALLEYEQYYDLPSAQIRRNTTDENGESDHTMQIAAEKNEESRHSFQSPANGGETSGQLLQSTVISTEKSRKSHSSLIHRILLLYRKHFIYESEVTSVELMQAYTDLQEYENARFWMEQTGRLQARKKHFTSTVSTALSTQPDTPDGVKTSDSTGIQLDLTERTPLLMLETFAGRDDIYSVENTSAGQHRKTELQERPLTEQQLLDHLRGKQTVGTYIQRPNATVRFIVWDIDISKQFLLKQGNRGVEFDACLQKAFQKAKEIQKLLENKGMNGYIEFSGFRGFHVWLFLSEWIPVRFSNMLTDRIEEDIIPDNDITVESFPNKVRLKAGRFGQVLKIPYGIHVRSGLRSYFIDDDGQPITNIDAFADTLASYSLSAIRKVLSYSILSAQITGNTASTSGQSKGNIESVPAEATENTSTVLAPAATIASNKSANESESLKSDITGLQTELLDSFGDITSSIKEILLHCSLMQYLCLKSKRTGYLTHFERLSVLYVFGHVGEEGKEFVHEVMRHTMNYQYNVTQRFIDRIPEKPVSCLKLREQYRKISAEIGCNCNFKRMKNCYPSPVLHALSLSGDMQEKITVPTSRTLSAEKEQKVIDELNVHKKAQELAVRILELRKQQRSIERSVHKAERELEKIYDSVDADALEIEMGLLVRRRKENSYEWVIEI